MELEALRKKADEAEKQISEIVTGLFACSKQVQDILVTVHSPKWNIEPSGKYYTVTRSLDEVKVTVKVNI